MVYFVKCVVLTAIALMPSVLALKGFQALGFSEWASGWLTVPVMIANVFAVERAGRWYQRARSRSAPTPRGQTPYRR